MQQVSFEETYFGGSIKEPDDEEEELIDYKKYSEKEKERKADEQYTKDLGEADLDSAITKNRRNLATLQALSLGCNLRKQEDLDSKLPRCLGRGVADHFALLRLYWIMSLFYALVGILHTIVFYFGMSQATDDPIVRTSPGNCGATSCTYTKSAARAVGLIAEIIICSLGFLFACTLQRIRAQLFMKDTILRGKDAVTAVAHRSMVVHGLPGSLYPHPDDSMSEQRSKIAKVESMFNRYGKLELCFLDGSHSEIILKNVSKLRRLKEELYTCEMDVKRYRGRETAFKNCGCGGHTQARLRIHILDELISDCKFNIEDSISRDSKTAHAFVVFESRLAKAQCMYDLQATGLCSKWFATGGRAKYKDERKQICLETGLHLFPDNINWDVPSSVFLNKLNDEEEVDIVGDWILFTGRRGKKQQKEKIKHRSSKGKDTKSKSKVKEKWRGKGSNGGDLITLKTPGKKKNKKLEVLPYARPVRVSSFEKDKERKERKKEKKQHRGSSDRKQRAAQRKNRKKKRQTSVVEPDTIDDSGSSSMVAAVVLNFGNNVDDNSNSDGDSESVYERRPKQIEEEYTEEKGEERGLNGLSWAKVVKVTRIFIDQGPLTTEDQKQRILMNAISAVSTDSTATVNALVEKRRLTLMEDTESNEDKDNFHAITQDMDGPSEISLIREQVKSLHGLSMKTLPPIFFTKGEPVAMAFTTLTQLSLHSNKLTALPPAFELLAPTLKELHLNRNFFTTDGINVVVSLTKLEVLNLHGNCIGPELPESFENLSALRILNVGKNAIEKFGYYLENFQKIEKLFFHHNRLQRLPQYIAHLPKLQVFRGDNNPLENGLLQVVMMKNIRALQTWFAAQSPILTSMVSATEPPKLESRKSDPAELSYRGKLVLLGSPLAGKTSLYRSLYDMKIYRSQLDDRTIGIDIARWSIPLHDNYEKKLDISVWDFAGQTIYQDVHHFFLSSNTLYLLCIDIRWLGKAVVHLEEPLESVTLRKEYEEKVQFWIDSIQSRVPGAVIQIVFTYLDSLEVPNGLTKAVLVERCRVFLMKLWTERESLHSHSLTTRLKTLKDLMTSKDNKDHGLGPNLISLLAWKRNQKIEENSSGLGDDFCGYEQEGPLGSQNLDISTLPLRDQVDHWQYLLRNRPKVLPTVLSVGLIENEHEDNIHQLKVIRSHILSLFLNKEYFRSVGVELPPLWKSIYSLMQKLRLGDMNSKKHMYIPLDNFIRILKERCGNDTIEWGAIKAGLAYFEQCGDTVMKNQLVFIEPAWLMRVIKTIVVTDNANSSLYSVLRKVEVDALTKATLEKEFDLYRRSHILSSNVLNCLWEKLFSADIITETDTKGSSGSKDILLESLRHLMVQFSIFGPIPSTTAVKFLVPCRLTKVIDDESFRQLWYKQRVNSKPIQIGRKYTFYQFTPPGIIARLLPMYCSHNVPFKSLYWRNGCMITISLDLYTWCKQFFPAYDRKLFKVSVRTLLYLNKDTTDTTLPSLEVYLKVERNTIRRQLLRGLKRTHTNDEDLLRSKEMKALFAELWNFHKPFIEQVESTLQYYPGLHWSASIPCPVCVEELVSPSESESIDFISLESLNVNRLQGGIEDSDSDDDSDGIVCANEHSIELFKLIPIFRRLSMAESTENVPCSSPIPSCLQYNSIVRVALVSKDPTIIPGNASNLSMSKLEKAWEQIGPFVRTSTGVPRKHVIACGSGFFVKNINSGSRAVAPIFLTAAHILFDRNDTFGYDPLHHYILVGTFTALDEPSSWTYLAKLLYLDRNDDIAILALHQKVDVEAGNFYHETWKQSVFFGGQSSTPAANISEHKWWEGELNEHGLYFPTVKRLHPVETGKGEFPVSAFAIDLRDDSIFLDDQTTIKVWGWESARRDEHLTLGEGKLTSFRGKNIFHASLYANAGMSGGPAFTRKEDGTFELLGMFQRSYAEVGSHKICVTRRCLVHHLLTFVAHCLTSSMKSKTYADICGSSSSSSQKNSFVRYFSGKAEESLEKLFENGKTNDALWNIIDAYIQSIAHQKV
eukprot:g3205.t1